MYIKDCTRLVKKNEYLKILSKERNHQKNIIKILIQFHKYKSLSSKLIFTMYFKCLEQSKQKLLNLNLSYIDVN